MPVVKFPYTAEGRRRAAKAQRTYGGRIAHDAPARKKGGPVKRPKKNTPRKR